MITSKFDHLINFLENKSILITTHDIVDLDALASCFLLKELIKKLISYKALSIYFSELSKNTKSFIDRFSLKFPNFTFNFNKDLDSLKYDVLIILDTNNLDLVELTKGNFNLPIIFIDHHLNLENKYKLNIEDLNLIYDDFSSTAEIIYKMMMKSNLDISLPFKYLLISAILTDSGFFRHSNTETIQTISKILDNSIEIQDIFALFNNHTDISEKIAKIKGIQRVKLIRIDPWLVGITNVSSFGAAVASTLINIGFDISIVYSQVKNRNYKITTRAKKSICRETSLHLGKIINEMHGGSGGGHDGAASFNGEIDIDDFLKILLEKIKKLLITS